LSGQEKKLSLRLNKNSKTMPVTSTYNETVETQIYWNLLKSLSNTVKAQLVRKLNQSLTTTPDNSVVYDKAEQTAYYELLRKFDTYKKYTKGWDGDDAVPLTQKVIDNFSLILERVDAHLLCNLTIYPETNGTLLIDSTKREAGISLGDNNFSYYEIDGDKVIGKNAIPFSVSAVSEVISLINR
jgi:hypothetical protein